MVRFYRVIPQNHLFLEDDQLLAGLSLAEDGLEDPSSDIVAIWPVGEPRLRSSDFSIMQDFRLEWRDKQYKATMTPEPFREMGLFLWFTGTLVPVCNG